MSNVKTQTTLVDADLNPVFENLKVANRAYNAIYPGEIADRQQPPTCEDREIGCKFSRDGSGRSQAGAHGLWWSPALQAGPNRADG